MSTNVRGLPARAFHLLSSEDRWQGHVRITAILRPNGSLMPWTGAKWPKVRSETLVELVIPMAFLSDPAEIETLAAERTVTLLQAGATLLLMISDKGIPQGLRKAVIQETHSYPAVGKFVEVTLPCGLRLTLRPNRRSSLEKAECAIPALGQTADSLNEAYRLISQAFEPWRRAPGGNVFLKAYYFDHGTWLPLDALRRWVEAGREATDAIQIQNQR